MKMKKRLLGILLSLVMVLGLMSGMSLTALAWDGNPYADLVPTGSEETDALTAKQVTFRGKQWYVIKDDSTSATEGTLTLLYADNLGNAQFDEKGSNVYGNSSIKTKLANMTATGTFKNVAEAIKDTENGKLYLLSVEEANEVPQNVRADIDVQSWWLRTARDSGKVAYVYAGDTKNPGRIPNSGLDVTRSTDVGVRPALQLDLSKVVYDATNNAFYIPATAPTDITVTGATLVAGYGAGRVSVTATAAEDHTLSYQWYQSTTNSNEGVVIGDGKVQDSSLIDNGYSEINRSGYREIDPNISFGYREEESSAKAVLTVNGGTFMGGRHNQERQDFEEDRQEAQSRKEVHIQDPRIHQSRETVHRKDEECIRQVVEGKEN